MLAHLRLLSTSDLQRRFDLPEGEHVIGREVRAGIRVPLPSVAKRHAVLRVSDDGVSIEPAEAAADVEVNGQPAAGPVPLNHGDIIRIGSVRFRVEPDEHDDQVDPPRMKSMSEFEIKPRPEPR